ncbi:type II toxin-antitoxin system HicA family toxin [Candidatus Acetothermia bacterium]|nr:type II toxin-antitoxin system HicA family toxin [Candidatus Acetothermia bacterium]
MSDKLPTLKAREVVAVLQRVGFRFIRQRGSHAIYVHPDGRMTEIPIHSGEDIGRGLLRKIIRDMKISREEFLKLWRS